jgi:hypothetical protein
MVPPLGTLRPERMVSPALVGAQHAAPQLARSKAAGARLSSRPAPARLVPRSEFAALPSAVSPPYPKRSATSFDGNNVSKHRCAGISYSAVHSFTE